MSGSRSKTGCWTCRLRRKKCDEETPQCSTCTSRDLFCYGYGEKPAWMLGKDWKQVMDMDEAKAIRKGAERAYSQRRKSKKPQTELPWTANVLVFEDPTLSHGGIVDRTWADCRQTLRDCDYTPDYRYMQMFLDVIFPLQWGFFDLHHRKPGRQWLFDAIIACEPMHHASLGLCLSFESGLKAGYTNGHCDVTPQVRSSRLLALKGLQPHITDIQQKEVPCGPWLLARATRAVAIITFLTSLEIFAEAGGAWDVHQSAAGAVLDMIETQVAGTVQVPPTAELDANIGSIGQLLASSPPSFETQALEFFVSTYVWADILSEAAHGAWYGKPRVFDYLPLLKRNILDMRSTMGCRNSIMIAIKEVSMLALSPEAEHHQQINDIDALSSRIQDVIREEESVWHALEGSEADSCWVTLLHAFAALVYLQVASIHLQAQGPSDHSQEYVKIHENATKCLELLEALPPHLLIRVCWPFTIAGCMAGAGDICDEAQTSLYHSRFREVVKRVESAGHVLGFAWKGLIVMEECWKLRKCKPELFWCWRTTMEHMKTRILLI
jgi:C6 transcription factor Pro1